MLRLYLPYHLRRSCLDSTCNKDVTRQKQYKGEVVISEAKNG